ncbi:MAG: DUF6580 family putative transport protein [Bacteroidota bacterium]
MKNNRTNIIMAIGLIAVAAITRVICNEMHWYNFAPIAAIGLFSGAVIKEKRYAFLFAILGQLLADVYFQLFTSTPGFYDMSQLFVYGGLVLVTLLGAQMGQPRALKILGFSVAGSVVFFLLSNFGVWFSIEFGTKDLYGYGKGLQGLQTTFIMAIPFFKKSLMADVVGTGLLFGTYQLVQSIYIGAVQKVKA